MTTLVPLVVAVPLLAAAALAALGQFVSGRLAELVAILVSLAVAVMSILLLFRSAHHTLTYWFGGWEPRHGVALGISFSVEPLSAALAALVGVLATAALVVSWDYFDPELPRFFPVLILVFQGAMTGFALSSDLFNMFVFFEVMSVVAFALTGYRIEQSSALQGAINFAIVNSIGAFMLLTGIALLYGRTGALNLAQIGESLAARRPDGLVIVAFTLLAAGFLTKAGAIPFHFWLSDAYAVAPAPVCVLFAGVMSDLGLHGVARTYWEGFSGTLGGHAEAVRAVLVVLGALTALLGGVMAFVQAGIKRMLAFVVIAHLGCFLAAFGLLSARGLAGATLYVVADGLVKGGVFCAVAHLARRTGHTDELEGWGAGRVIPASGVIVAVGALGLAALPVLATLAGGGWLPLALLPGSALTGAAVLRSAARLFAGIGPSHDRLLVHAPRGEEREVAPTPRGGVLMWGPAAVLVVAGIVAGFTPGLAARAVAHAQAFVDRPAVARETLAGVAPPPVQHAFRPTLVDYLWAVAAVTLAFAIAWLALYRRRIPAALRGAAATVALPALGRLRLLHDGVAGDYVAWLVFGTALLGGLFTVLIR